MFSKVCDICNKKLSLINFNAKDGTICSTCIRDFNKSLQKTLATNTIEELKSYLKNKSNFKYEGIDFVVSKKIDNILEVDEIKKLVLLIDNSFGSKIINFEKILDFDVYEDGDSLISGGLSQALIGGLAFGGVGAIVGAVIGKKRTQNVVNQLKLKITINDISNPLIILNILDEEVKRESEKYRELLTIVEEATAIFAVIIHNNKSESIKEYGFCHSCGTKLIEEANFCHKCGMKL